MSRVRCTDYARPFIAVLHENSRTQSVEITGETRHVRIVSGMESLEYECRELRLVGASVVVGREMPPASLACVPDVSTYRETGADGTIRVPFPGTEGSGQLDMLRARHERPVAIVGRIESGVFVSSLAVPMDHGNLVLQADRVAVGTVRIRVDSLREMVR